MNKKAFLSLLVLIGLVIYDVLFWHQTLGLNILLFTVWVITANALLRPERFRSKSVLLLGAASLYSAICVLLVNSALSCILAICCNFLFAAFVQLPVLRSAVAGAAHTLLNIPAVFSFLHDHSENPTTRVGRAWYWTRLLVLPFIVALIFLGIYSVADDTFGHYVANSLDTLSHIFDYITVPRLFFLSFGLLLVVMLIYKARWNNLIAEAESQAQDELGRKKAAERKGKRRYPSVLYQHGLTAGIRNENRSTTGLFILLNLVLLALNCTDIRWVWLNAPSHPDYSLKEFVHFGTDMLIFSIILASSLILLCFRNKQNFYSKNIWLKRMAYIWIAQNMFLCLTVCLRNYQYIHFHGLAYKRLGVIFFLALTLTGLITLLIKISQKKTVYYLMRINGWAAVILFLGLSALRWDIVIVNYNLHHWNAEGIDTDFYMDIPDACLPMVIQDSAMAQRQIDAHINDKVRWVQVLSYAEFQRRIEARKDNFMDEYDKMGWPSWNRQDAQTYQALKTLGHTTPAQ